MNERNDVEWNQGHVRIQDPHCQTHDTVVAVTTKRQLSRFSLRKNYLFTGNL